MTRWQLALWVSVALGACGEEAEVGHVVATVLVDPQARPLYKSVDVYLLAGRTNAGAPLDCVGLAHGSPATRADLVPRAHTLGPYNDTHLAGIAPESGLLLVVDAYPTTDGTGSRNGYGCKDGISIVAGQTTAVTLILGTP